MEIVYKKTMDLIPYVNNTRTHNDKQVNQIASSIKEFGFTNPILIDEQGGIIAGHGRLMAANKLKMQEVPCIVLDGLTEAQKKAYIIADNKLALNAGWDEELLKLELENLKELDFDIDLIGFDEKELDNLLKIEEDVIEDDFDEEPPENPISKRGDIWLLGRHRLMCGDSTSEEDVKTLIDNNPIYLIQTDPPYGMKAVSKSGVLSKNYKTDIIGDDDNNVAIKSFELCQKLFKNSNQVWWGANYYTECLPSSECWLVWDKNNGQSDQTDCELAWANFRSVVRQFTLTSEKKNRVHPTQKPVKLFEWIVKKFDKEEAFKTVLDLFGGSGFTMIGAEQLNMTSFIMELDNKFVDVIVSRYINFKQSDNDVYLIRNGEKLRYDEVVKMNGIQEKG